MMPTTPPTPTPAQPKRKSNTQRAYRSKTHERTSAQSQASDLAEAYRAASVPLSSLALTGLEVPADLLLADDSPPYDAREDHPFTSRQVALLQAYIQFSGDPVKHAFELCQSVGYQPGSLDRAQTLLQSVLQRIEAMDDIKRAMRLFGMGLPSWSRKVHQIAHCGSPRVEVIAAKLWGLALGVFDDPAPAAGARVVIESAVEASDGTRSATRVSIDPSSPALPPGNELVFATAKPTVQRQKRRKMLNKTE